MKYALAFASLPLFILPAFSSVMTLSYDTVYDDGATSLDRVACSNGNNGLVTRGYTTFASLPSYPYICGIEFVKGWNSPNCGTCYNVTYGNPGEKKTFSILAVDTDPNGMNIGENVMNKMTNGNAVEYGTVEADVEQVAESYCGL